MSKKQELIDTFYEVEPLDRDQFLKVRETLTRIGISSKRRIDGKQTLWQTCHVLHKRGRYYICHFKQLFLLDGRSRSTDYTEEDMDRTEYIVSLLEDWGLVRCYEEVERPLSNVVVIPYKQKGEWNLRAKYTIGVVDES